LRLSEKIGSQIGRLLNNSNHPDIAPISHLATAAGRAVESLDYLVEIDDRRFSESWPQDNFSNDAIDDGHVRWAASTGLTSLDLCMAAASRLGGFAKFYRGHEDSIREFYRVQPNGIVDARHQVPPPWRAWIDAVIADTRYGTLLQIRNALVHADTLRTVFGTTDEIKGHQFRYGYNLGPLYPPVQTTTHLRLQAREIVLLSQGVASTHVSNFAATLESMT
jgi:hypothetical protein